MLLRQELAVWTPPLLLQPCRDKKPQKQVFSAPRGEGRYWAELARPLLDCTMLAICTISKNMLKKNNLPFWVLFITANMVNDPIVAIVANLMVLTQPCSISFFKHGVGKIIRQSAFIAMAITWVWIFINK